MMANYQPPPGYVFDPNSGMYYQSVPGNDPATGQTGNWTTWFNAATGEYTQQFYPAATPVAPIQQQQPVMQKQLQMAHQQPMMQHQQHMMHQQHHGVAGSNPSQASGTRNDVYQARNDGMGIAPQTKRLSPLMYAIPVVVLLVGVGLAFLLYGRDSVSSGNDVNKPDALVIADDGGLADSDNTSSGQKADTDIIQDDQGSNQDNQSSDQGTQDLQSAETVTLQPHDADRANELAILNQEARDANSAFSEGGLDMSVFVRDYELVFAHHMDFSLEYEEAKRRHFEHVDPAGLYIGIVERLRELGVTSPVVVVEYWDENGRVFFSHSYRTLTDREKAIMEEVAVDLRRSASNDDTFSVHISEVAFVMVSQFNEDFGMSMEEMRAANTLLESDRATFSQLAEYIRERGVESPVVILEVRDAYGNLILKEQFR